MNNFIDRVLGRFDSFRTKSRLNIFATLYINFRTLPISQAFMFPIFIYGRVKLYNLRGNIIINAPIKSGMIKLGITQGYFSAPKKSAMIFLSATSKLIFNGPCKFDCDYAIRITGGTVSIGAYIGFGSDTKIYSENSITIGDYCRIPFGSCFMDTNFHYTINTQDGTVHAKSAPIVIGKYNWIGNTSTFMKGARTPDGAVIASKSFLNKDFVKLGNGAKNIVIAGAPAKIVSGDCTRILSLKIQQEMNEWFESHPAETKCQNKALLDSYRDTTLYEKMFE